MNHENIFIYKNTYAYIYIYTTTTDPYIFLEKIRTNLS